MVVIVSKIIKKKVQEVSKFISLKVISSKKMNIKIVSNKKVVVKKIEKVVYGCYCNKI